MRCHLWDRDGNSVSGNWLVLVGRRWVCFHGRLEIISCPVKIDEAIDFDWAGNVGESKHAYRVDPNWGRLVSTRKP